MSLLSEAMEACNIIDTVTVADGYGGYTNQYRKGADIQCAITFNTSMEARQAEAQGVKSLYTITTDKGVNLQYHQIIRRERDGKVFRITSDGDDKFTPNSAGLNMRQCTAEEFRLG